MPKKRSKCDPNDGKMVIFFQEIVKIAQQLGALPPDPVNNTLELHQYVQRAAQLQHFLSMIILTFGSSP